MKDSHPDLSAIADGHVADADDIPRDDLKALRPLQRLRLLGDENSLQLIRSRVTSIRMGEKAREGDGVLGGALRIAGRPVFGFAQDSAYAGGSLGAQHADTIVRVQQLARRTRVPVIGFVESGGARMQEGLEALNGYARIFSEHVALSGQVPQISVITGTSAGGGSYSPALTDFVVMTEAASMFLTGPAVVREVTGEQVTAAELGGPKVHGRNGVCHFTVATDIDAIFLVRQLLSYLPANAWESPPTALPAEPSGPDPGGVVPLDSRRAYDVRAAIDGIVDAGSRLESSVDWAPNLVTTFARIEGCPVGIVANQPKHLGGVIDADASQKGARFVRTCNAFGIPLVVLVDTPGFLPGSAQESRGVIRHGAELLHAFAASTVPRFTVVLRKAFGGAYITMNSKDLGADLYLAWSRAELGIMGAEQAVGVVHRRALAAAADPAAEQRRLAESYAAEHLGAQAAARLGAVDEVIRPGETRSRLAWALATIAPGYPRAHTNRA
ncbi:methylmalonyl-CoA carboxyltransferase [Solirubrobacter phytolaccae]|uniref:Methylmalonyl-CoA carboxyltransferase n=1 Tax=Solirubrobacter phytolaccae TaxID=1404360 RepID=A0A9X3N833_9ACTN|nr:carboxyl transferase domain-containing protein [Solirubrobacter phytolaccae]MDA0181690.1 methylmalonyl-CoA carboxyltransferase [Solirubrobacter phytolaccae]